MTPDITPPAAPKRARAHAARKSNGAESPQEPKVPQKGQSPRQTDAAKVSPKAPDEPAQSERGQQGRQGVQGDQVEQPAKAEPPRVPHKAQSQEQQPHREVPPPRTRPTHRTQVGQESAPPLQITFFTTNAGKFAEMGALLAPARLVQDGRGYPEIQADTLRAVTAAGADYLLAAGATPPFILEDSGLFVTALRGFPGVHSRQALDTVGIAGLLRLMGGLDAELRGARFETDLLYVDAGGARHHFTGMVEGHIAHEPAGTGGFGFDPVFVPRGEGRTFAEMGASKQQISHRAHAAGALRLHLGHGPNQTGKP